MHRSRSQQARPGERDGRRVARLAHGGRRRRAIEGRRDGRRIHRRVRAVLQPDGETLRRAPGPGNGRRRLRERLDAQVVDPLVHVLAARACPEGEAPAGDRGEPDGQIPMQRLALVIHVEQTVAVLDPHVHELVAGHDAADGGVLRELLGRDRDAGDLHVHGGGFAAAVVVDVEGHDESVARTLLADRTAGQVVREVEAETVRRVAGAPADAELERGREATHRIAGVQVIDVNGRLEAVHGVGQADVASPAHAAG